MHRDLILKAFKKAEENEKKRDGKTPSNTSIAKLLSNFIEEKEQFQFGERRFRDYYNLAIKKGGNDVSIMQQKVILGLCKYLGYKDYHHFLKENSPEKKYHNNFISNINKNKTTIGSIIIVLLISYFGYELTKKDCMVWIENNHFERIKCEYESEIKSIQYNKVIFDNFKRVEPDCNYHFFKPDGSENLWYGKSIKGELEFFTYHGLHPTTGKTLDPITQYMIDKHICNK
ncbi:hypothetical protein [Aureibaculum luteum]|uniref:hypothetical protein n=1 Tax=Aureibaculum luteum TaxID=1548456 RepID=UPI000E4B18C8|nr:hypothetical protein [Aureibaculum luteum]